MSNPSAVDANASLPSRVALWMSERFPPGTYTILVTVYGLAGLSVGWATGGERYGLPSLIVLWLFFLQLRILDEHKDHERDQHTHPERALSRGVVTLALLARMGVVAVVIQAAIVAWLGVPAAYAWLAALVFSGLMFIEFGVGRWLEQRIVLYALTHNPVMIPLALFVVWSTGTELAPVHAAFASLSSFAMLGFEFGRKTYLPHEEHPDVPSYTSVLGQTQARGMLAASHVGSMVALGVTLHLLGVAPLLIVAAVGFTGVPGLISCAPGRPAKQVELGASVVLLLSLLSILLLCWTV